MMPLDLLLYSLAVAVGLTVAGLGATLVMLAAEHLDVRLQEMREDRAMARRERDRERERDAESRGRF